MRNLFIKTGYIVMIITFNITIVLFSYYQNYKTENERLNYLKKEYQTLTKEITIYESFKNTYSESLNSEQTLAQEKTALTEKINNLNSEINNVQLKINDLNQKIKSLS